MLNQKVLQQGAEAVIVKIGNKVIKDRISKSYRLKELDEKIRKLRTKSETKLLIKASSIINCPKPMINNAYNQTSKNHSLLITKKSANKNKQEINNNYQIIMPFIKGKKLSAYLDSFSITKQKLILNQISKDVAKLHDADIIHGDLTTSNMIYVEDLPAHSRSQINNNFINKKSNKEYSNISLIGRHSSLTTLNKSVSNANSKLGVGGERFREGENKLTNIQTRSGVGGDGRWVIYFIDFGLGYSNGKVEDKAVDIHLLKQALEAKHFKNWETLFKSFIQGYLSINKTESKTVLERLKAVEKRGRYKH